LSEQIELIADEYDLPGVSWCWMLFGSEGWVEQTFATDQDNGLIFQPSKPGETESLRKIFLPFAEAVSNALRFCGFERCRGKSMASNPEWCLSADEWQTRFATWLGVKPPPRAPRRFLGDVSGYLIAPVNYTESRGAASGWKGVINEPSLGGRST
jgi:CBS domain-containing protein